MSVHVQNRRSEVITYTIKSLASSPTLIETYRLEDFGPFKNRNGFGPIITEVMVKVQYLEATEDDEESVDIYTRPLGYDTTSKGVRDKRGTLKLQSAWGTEYRELENTLAQMTLEKFLTTYPHYRNVEVTGLCSTGSINAWEEWE